MRYFIVFYVVCAILVVQFDCNRLVNNAITMPGPLSSSPVEQKHQADHQGLRFAVIDVEPGVGMELTDEEIRFLSNRAREVVFNVSEYDVVTEENAVVLLAAHGKTLEECAEAKCELELGVMLGADFVSTTRLDKIGDYIFVTMKIHNTSSSSLAAATSFRSKDLPEVHSEIEIHINKMLRQIN